MMPLSGLCARHCKNQWRRLGDTVIRTIAIVRALIALKLMVNYRSCRQNTESFLYTLATGTTSLQAETSVGAERFVAVEVSKRIRFRRRSMEYRID
jgi:hypothetical protein